MRRDVLYKSVSKIISDITDCDIYDFLRSYIDQFRKVSKESGTRPMVPLSLFQRYMLATYQYSDDEKDICRILGIEKLLEPAYWESLNEPKSMSEIHEMVNSVRFAVTQLPKVLSLIKQDYVQEIRSNESELPEELKGKELLTVLVVEDEGQFSSPARLTKSLSAISELYSVFATIEGENESDLIVLALDSGSDKSFDFLGMAKLMELVKETIIAIWDRRVFHRQRHVSESIALIAESLPVLEKIEELKRNGSIEREQAELLKRKTISGATQFIEAGATIPELESESYHSPKQLMRPEPKLLVSPWDHGNRNEVSIKSGEGTSEESGLSEEEKSLLELLKKKSQSKTAVKKKRVSKKKST